MTSAKEKYRVLLIEDDDDARANLVDILEIDGFDVVEAGTAAAAQQRTDWRDISIILLDRKLPDGNALDLLPWIHSVAPEATTVVITAYADLDGAIVALRNGAADYILKPINADALRAALVRIVDRIKIQRALRESEIQLEEERRRALQNERLAAIGETMAGLIHEGRNALQRSKACLEMLALDVQDRPKALDLVVRTQRAQEDLHQLYEEVRQYAAPINLRHQLCDLSSIWREAWQDLSQSHESKRLSLDEKISAGDLYADVDRFAIGQVCRNIFENAIAASPIGGTILICADETEIATRPAITICVQDQGPGLDDQQLQNVFKAFYTTKTKGTGLGMAIVQRIVTSHGGQITAGNALQGGAKIEVTLPREIP